MASKERNALAELAEFIETEAHMPSDETLDKIVERFGVSASKRIIERRRKFDKCFRIIAELANVETANDLVGLIGKCHAIAEEGAKE